MPSSGTDALRDNVVALPQRDEAHERRSVRLTSGRTYDLEAGERDDRITVRSRAGQVLLQIDVGEQGPRLRFESAELDLVAADKLRLHAGVVEVHASEQLAIGSEGDLHLHVSGNKHEHVVGDARFEARGVELQANERAVRVQAMEQITLDGSHIGLNDDPCPKPFGWSAITKDSVVEEPIKKEPMKKEPMKKEPIKKEPIKKEPIKKEQR